MNYILRDLSQTKTYQSFIKNDKYPITLSGLVCVSKSALIALAQKEKNKRALVLTYNELEAQRIIKDLSYFCDNVVYFPKKEISIYDYDVESSDILYKRMDVLNKINTEKSIIIVTTIESAMQKMINKKGLFENIIKVSSNDIISFDEIKDKLVKLGYERKPIVESRQDFSIRGNILDIALNEQEGVRIETWGDDVDSIRKFNLSSQRSTEMVKSVEITPIKESILENSCESIAKKIENKYTILNKDILSDIEEIRQENYENKIDKYFNEFYESQSDILDYCSDFNVFIDEPEKVSQRIDGIKEDNKNLIKDITDKERFVPEALENILDFEFNKKEVINLKEADEKENHFEFREVNLFKGDIKNFEIGLKDAIISKKKVVILAGSKENQNKIAKIIENIEDLKLTNTVKVDDLDNILLKPGEIILSTGAISSGFENKETKMLVISSDEFLNVQKNRARKANDKFTIR